MLNQSFKRRQLVLVALWPWTSACMPNTASDGPQHRFDGIGVVLVVDAVPNARMEGVDFYGDLGWKIYASSVVAERNRSFVALGGSRVPLTVRVTWRDHPKAVRGRMGIDYEGPIIGDYTIRVAERIPQAVLDDIRARGGGLRLKFRLKPDGVLFGWDIERDGGGFSKFDMPGGDFLETRF